MVVTQKQITMKTKLTLGLLLFTFCISSNWSLVKAQCTGNIVFQDSTFKQLLIYNPAINTNQDNEIQCSEATSYYGELRIESSQIMDITGLEAFTSITELYLSFVKVDSINLSSNISLTKLKLLEIPIIEVDLTNNLLLKELTIQQIYDLPVLNLTTNTLLEELYSVSNFNLKEIDVKNCPLLRVIDCPHSILESLDLSANPNLEYITCWGTSLSELNIDNGNISNLKKVIVDENPNLFCISVGDTSYFDDNPNIILKDNWCQLNNQCTVAIQEASQNLMVDVYPNPTSTYLYFETRNIDNRFTVGLYDIIGKQILTKQVEENVLDVSDVPRGNYVLVITDKEKIVSRQQIIIN